jgi:hypothetical protein
LEKQLEAVIAKLNLYKAGQDFTGNDIQVLQDQVHSIDQQVLNLFTEWNDGAVKETDGTIAPGQAVL